MCHSKNRGSESTSTSGTLNDFYFKVLDDKE